MRTLLIVSLIFAACYLLSRPVFSSRIPFLGFRYLFLSGTEFLLVGFLAGSRGFNLLPASALDALDPVIHLGLGWAGFIFGLQFDRRMVRLYPPIRYGLAFFQSAVVVIIAAAGGWAAFGLLFPEADPVARLRAAALIGIATGPTSPSSIYYFSEVMGFRGRVNRLVKFIAGVDAIPPVLLLGVFAGLFHLFTSRFETLLEGWQWLVIGTALGALLGFLLTALIGLRFSRDELLLFVIGMVVLSAGIARYLHLPAVYVSFVTGLTVANTAWHKEEVHKVVAYPEKPLYLTLLVLAGTSLSLRDPRIVVLALLVVGLRLAGKTLGNLPWHAARFEPEVRTPWLGLALLSQGAMAIVLTLDFEFLYRADLARAPMNQMVASAVIVAVMINEVLSPLFLRFLDRRS